MIKIFQDGGPIMWPLLLCSIICVATVLERAYFIIREQTRRRPAVVEAMLRFVEHRDPARAIQAGQGSGDFVARTLVYALDTAANPSPAPCCARPTRS